MLLVNPVRSGGNKLIVCVLRLDMRKMDEAEQSWNEPHVAAASAQTTSGKLTCVELCCSKLFCGYEHRQPGVAITTWI